MLPSPWTAATLHKQWLLSSSGAAHSQLLPVSQATSLPPDSPSAAPALWPNRKLRVPTPTPPPRAAFPLSPLMWAAGCSTTNSFHFSSSRITFLPPHSQHVTHKVSRSPTPCPVPVFVRRWSPACLTASLLGTRRPVTLSRRAGTDSRGFASAPAPELRFTRGRPGDPPRPRQTPRLSFGGESPRVPVRPHDYEMLFPHDVKFAGAASPHPPPRSSLRGGPRSAASGCPGGAQESL